jgi:hypothetical protein
MEKIGSFPSSTPFAFFVSVRATAIHGALSLHLPHIFHKGYRMPVVNVRVGRKKLALLRHLVPKTEVTEYVLLQFSLFRADHLEKRLRLICYFFLGGDS